MHIRKLHDWNLSPADAIEVQKTLAAKVVDGKSVTNAKLIAGTDVSVDRMNNARAAVVVLKMPEMEVVEKVTMCGRAVFPYIPGLLSFREIPLLTESLLKLSNIPDIIIVDGQGTAHPRKMGLACHLGLITDIPTIGCAKTPLFGNYKLPGELPGSYENITDKAGNIIGVVLRTKKGIKPVFVSVGNNIDMASCINWIMLCCKGYRLPEPTRLAHLASKEQL